MFWNKIYVYSLSLTVFRKRLVCFLQSWLQRSKVPLVLRTLKARRTAKGSSAVSLCRRGGQQRWAIGSNSFSFSLSTHTHSSSTSSTWGQRHAVYTLVYIWSIYTYMCTSSFKVIWPLETTWRSETCGNQYLSTTAILSTWLYQLICTVGYFCNTMSVYYLT